MGQTLPLMEAPSQQVEVRGPAGLETWRDDNVIEGFRLVAFAPHALTGGMVDRLWLATTEQEGIDDGLDIATKPQTRHHGYLVPGTPAPVTAVDGNDQGRGR